MKTRNAPADVGRGPDDGRQRGVPGADGEGRGLPRSPAGAAGIFLRQGTAPNPPVVRRSRYCGGGGGIVSGGGDLFVVVGALA